MTDVKSQFLAALSANDGDEAIRLGWGLAQAANPNSKLLLPIAKFAASQAEWALASAAAQRYAHLQPADLDGALSAASLLAEGGRVATAASILEPWVARLPGSANVHHLLGVALVQLGGDDIDRGIFHLRAALRIMPQAGPTWLALAEAATQNADSVDALAIQRHADAMAEAPLALKTPFHFALGKVYADLGKIDDAFSQFAEGSRLARPIARGHRLSDVAAVRSIRGIRPDDLRGVSPVKVDGLRRVGPIFVMGLPRSGTTLVDQIITSHPAVIGGGEVNILQHAWRGLRGLGARELTSFVQSWPSPVDAMAEVGRRFAHLASQRFGEEGCFVDKTLLNGRMALHIACAFPDAPLIWLDRNPMATAWSCFRTYFQGALAWTFDLEDIAHHFAAEDAIREHCMQLLGSRILRVRYERLVIDPVAVADEILDHCRLPRDAAVYAPQSNGRPVQTSSVMQVRQPVNTRSVAAFEPYADKLKPFTEAYAAARAQFGLG